MPSVQPFKTSLGLAAPRHCQLCAELLLQGQSTSPRNPCHRPPDWLTAAERKGLYDLLGESALKQGVPDGAGGRPIAATHCVLLSALLIYAATKHSGCLAAGCNIHLLLRCRLQHIQHCPATLQWLQAQPCALAVTLLRSELPTVCTSIALQQPITACPGTMRCKAFCGLSCRNQGRLLQLQHRDGAR